MFLVISCRKKCIRKPICLQKYKFKDIRILLILKSPTLIIIWHDDDLDNQKKIHTFRSVNSDGNEDEFTSYMIVAVKYDNKCNFKEKKK